MGVSPPVVKEPRAESPEPEQTENFFLALDSRFWTLDFNKALPAQLAFQVFKIALDLLGAG